MTFLTKALDRLRGRPAAPEVEKSISSQQWLHERFDADSSDNESSQPKLRSNNYDSLGYQGHAWTYACISQIAGKGSSCPWRVMVKGEPAEQHALKKLLGYVNPILNDQRLFGITLLCLELWGQAYWKLERKGKAIEELWPIPPLRMKPGRINKGIVETYIYRNAHGIDSTIPGTEIIWLHYEGPGGAMDSASPMTAAAQAIQGDISALRANLQFFEVGGHPQFGLKTPADVVLTDDQRKRLKEDWAQSYAGLRRFFKPVVLDGGMSVEKIGEPPDGAWLQLREQLRQEILAVFHVPPAIVGLFESANFGVSIREQRKMMWTDCLRPRLDGIAADLNEQLVPQIDPAAEFEWDYQKVSDLAPDFAALMPAAVQAVTNGLMFVDEAREHFFDFRPLPDGLGKITYMPLNIVPADSYNEEAPALPATEAPAALPQEGATPAEGIPPTPKGKARQVAPTGQRRALPAKRPTRLSAAARQNVWKAHNRRLDARVVPLRKAVAHWYEGLEEEVLGNLSAAKELLAPRRMKAPSVTVLVFNPKQALGALWNAVRPELTEAYEEAGQEVIAQVGAAIRFDVSNPRVQELLADRKLQMKTVVDTAQERCRNVLAEGLASGETLPELRDRVLEWSSTGQKSHAMNVARTETNMATNGAVREGFRQAEVPAKEWLSVVDDRSRDDHAALDGKVVAIDDTFTLDSGEYEGPGDPAMGPDDACSCRCTLAAAFEVPGGESEE